MPLVPVGVFLDSPGAGEGVSVNADIISKDTQTEGSSGHHLMAAVQAGYVTPVGSSECNEAFALENPCTPPTQPRAAHPPPIVRAPAGRLSLPLMPKAGLACMPSLLEFRNILGYRRTAYCPGDWQALVELNSCYEPMWCPELGLTLEERVVLAEFKQRMAQMPACERRLQQDPVNPAHASGAYIDPYAPTVEHQRVRQKW